MPGIGSDSRRSTTRACRPRSTDCVKLISDSNLCRRISWRHLSVSVHRSLTRLQRRDQCVGQGHLQLWSDLLVTWSPVRRTAPAIIGNVQSVGHGARIDRMRWRNADRRAVASATRSDPNQPQYREIEASARRYDSTRGRPPRCSKGLATQRPDGVPATITPLLRDLAQPTEEETSTASRDIADYWESIGVDSPRSPFKPGVPDRLGARCARTLRLRVTRASLN